MNACIGRVKICQNNSSFTYPILSIELSILFLESQSFDSSQNAEGSTNSATVGAINDTVKVKKKSRSRVAKERRKKEDEQKLAAAGHAQDLSMVRRSRCRQINVYQQFFCHFKALNFKIRLVQTPRKGLSQKLACIAMIKDF